MNLWKARTKTGRVVYERRRHPWSWQDLLRAFRRGPPEVTFPGSFASADQWAKEADAFFTLAIDLVSLVGSTLVVWEDPWFYATYPEAEVVAGYLLRQVRELYLEVIRAQVGLLERSS